MKLRLTLLSFIAAAGFASAAASAESIAFVNFLQIIHDSSAGKSVSEQLDAKQSAFKAEMSKKEEALNKEHESIAQQQNILSHEAFNKKANEFRAKAEAAQKDMQAKRAALDHAMADASSQIQKAVFEIVGDLAKERGYTLVLPSSQIVYADPKLDITSEVMTRLNAKLPKLTANFKVPSRAKEEE